MAADIKKINALLETPESLPPYLDGLSNAQFRKASDVLGETLLPRVNNNTFWQVFATLFQHNRRAYLGTLLKALNSRIKRTGTTSNDLELAGLWGSEFCMVCGDLTETDTKKIVMSLLPLFTNPTDVERLLVQCGLMEASSWIPFLLQVQNKPCAFLLLKALRYVEHDRALLIRTCHFLMKRGDEQSFNMASLLRLYFGLEEVRGIFSLSLKPYQLARIEQNYDAFCTLF